MSLGTDRFGLEFGDFSRHGAVVFVDAVLGVEPPLAERAPTSSRRPPAATSGLDARGATEVWSSRKRYRFRHARNIGGHLLVVRTLRPLRRKDQTEASA